MPSGSFFFAHIGVDFVTTKRYNSNGYFKIYSR